MKKVSFLKSMFVNKTFTNTYMRIVWNLLVGSFATLLLLLTVILLYLIVYDGLYKDWFYPRFIANNKEGMWIQNTDRNNPLNGFYKDGKWGYRNNVTGKIIPTQYERIWQFSEGLAAVEKDKRLMFIDSLGNVVIDKKFGRISGCAECRFEQGYCIVNSVEGLTGLIDKQGNWALQPIYDDIRHEGGFWKVRSDDLYGLFSARLDTLFSVCHPRIDVEDGAVEVAFRNHRVKRYDCDMNVTNGFVIHSIGDLWIGKINEVGDSCYNTAQRMYYTVNVVDDYNLYYGLMDRNGKRITPPDYTSIDAIGEDLYLCQPQGFIINGKGQRVE